jgi:very-short-patch-repair endonuclease
MTAGARVDREGAAPADPMVVERLHRLFGYLRAVRAVFDRPVRDITASGEELLWQAHLAAVPGCRVGPGDPVRSGIVPDPRRPGRPVEAAADDEPWLLVRKQPAPPALKPLPAGVDRRLLRGRLDDPAEPPALDMDAIAALDDATAVKAKLTDWLGRAWRPWSRATAAQRLYRDLWDLALRLGQDEASLELVWGHGVLGWQPAGERLVHPLLVTPMQVEIDPDRGQVRVRPAAPTALEVAFLDGLGLPGLEALTERRDRLRDDPVDPWDAARTRELWAFVGNVLRADLAVRGDHGEPPAEPTPALAATSVLYVRRRTVSYRRFYERAAAALAAGALDGGPLIGVVAPGGPADRVGAPDADERLVMPLPTNAEQEEIGRRLAVWRGTTVQGPPGTGKTHTIANLISHLMAQGKRVLVTSHKEQPLEVLRSTLPERIRPLCVSLLGVGAGEFSQLDQSVQAILRETTTLDRDRAGWAIERAGEDLDRTEADLAAARAELAAGIELERSRFELDGRPRSAAEVGRWLAGADAGLRFIPDPLELDAEPPLDTAELAELYRLAARVSETDRALVASRRPDPAVLPRGDGLRALYAAVEAADRRLAELAAEPPASRIPASMSPAGLDAIARRTEEVAAVMAKVEEGWLGVLRGELRRSGPSATSWAQFVGFIDKAIAELYELGRRTGPHKIELPPEVPARQLTDQLNAMRAHLASGRSLSRMSLLGRFEMGGVVKVARIDGSPPRTMEDVELLLDQIGLKRRRGELVTAWNRQLAKVDGPTVDPDDPDPLAAIEAEVGAVRSAITFETSTWPEFRERLKWSGLRLARQPDPAEIQALREDVAKARTRQARDQAVERAKGARASAGAELERLREDIETGRRRKHASHLWAELATAMDLTDPEAWGEALAEAERLAALEPQVRRLDELAERLRGAAPLWAELIVAGRGDPVTTGDPAVAAEAWVLRQAETWLDRLVAAFDPRAVTERLDELTDMRRRQLGDLVAWSTWMAVAERITDDQRRALNGWVQAVRRIGKGTGKHANRYRGIAREQMDRCRDAVPVWIMPTYRVIETFEPSPDADGPPFDVVIVDESSQCDLFSLGVLALGDQVVVVGDDKQISPTLITDQAGVHELIEAHIADLPNARLLDTTASLYDVAKWAFPGVVMLREHFRCLPEIIAFSNELMYDGEILPLREEPEDPAWEPVRTTRVLGAERSGTVNEAEAEALVEAVVKCCADPAYDARSMGVISLMGEAQARHIQHQLLERLGEREYAARRIKCGDAYRFQGDERDVMFLSMVAASGDRQAAMTRLADRQRINVAASRARDQLWLFHSVDPRDLHPDDARAVLLRWCLDPPSREVDSGRPESPLERAVQRTLRTRGFTVRPQVRVGNYRIDLVVEGVGGGRLAVECDGEASAGIDRFDADERRQLILERLGWRFHHVRGSAFYRDQDATVADLLDRLAELEIEPARDPEVPTPDRAG